jgi:amino acid transporter
LNAGGPASLIIGFGVIGIVAFFLMQSLGELTTLYPAGGSFIGLADRFLDPGFGAAIGWSYFFLWICVLAAEYTVLCSVLIFWVPEVPLYGWFLIFFFVFLAFQMLPVNYWGASEYWLAITKLIGLTIFYLFCIVYVSGGINSDKLGARYWKTPGAFNGNGIKGVATTFSFCSTFYAGVESVAIASSETRNPARSIPTAIRQVIVRIIYVYMLFAVFAGLTCPADAPGLVGGGSRALRSPMTIAIQNAGWMGGVHLSECRNLWSARSAY